MRCFSTLAKTSTSVPRSGMATLVIATAFACAFGLTACSNGQNTGTVPKEPGSVAPTASANQRTPSKSESPQSLNWSTPQMLNSKIDLASVSCSSASFCMAVDNYGIAYWWNGSSWTGQQIDMSTSYDGLLSVSCPSANFCIAVDNDDTFFAWNGSSWSAPQATITR